MQVVQQVDRIPVENLDFFDDKPVIKKHGNLFPNNCRFLFVGPSGTGKSNCLLSLLFAPNGLQFENVYVYSKSLYQPKYQLLEQVMHGVRGMGYFPFKENDDIIDPVEARENSIIIFDDVIGDKQDHIKAYFSSGRHKGIDSAFLCQTYVKINKHLIRDNANILILYKQDDVNLRHIHQEQVGCDMNFNKFKELCSFCWNGSKHGFLTIVKDFDLNNGRYRRNFDEYIKL